jgi:hypothetical protein
MTDAQMRKYTIESKPDSAEGYFNDQTAETFS